VGGPAWAFGHEASPLRRACLATESCTCGGILPRPPPTVKGGRGPSGRVG
jgi:hypothetical protein